MNRTLSPRVFDANLVFLVSSLLFFTIGFTVQQREIFTGLAITQLTVILLPPVLFLELRKLNLRDVLRLRPITLRQGLLTVLITLFMYPAAVTANLIMLNILNRVGTLDIPQIPTAGSLMEYLRLILIVAVMAGVCEEVFFRGLIMKSYERMGQNQAIIISAVLFGLFHYNIYNLFGAIVLGLVFGMVVTATNSLMAGIIGHVVNNGFAVSLGFVFNMMAQWAPEEELMAAEIPVSDSLLASLFFFAMMAVAGMAASWFLYRKLKESPPANGTQTVEETEQPEESEKEKRETDQSSGDPAENETPSAAERDYLPQDVQLWEFFPLTGAVFLFIYIAVLQVSVLLGTW